jgi:hypothetical protein
MLLCILLRSNTQTMLKGPSTLGVIDRPTIARSDGVETRVEKSLHVFVGY